MLGCIVNLCGSVTSLTRDRHSRLVRADQGCMCVVYCSNITLLAWVLFYWVLFATLFFERNQWHMDNWDMQNEWDTAGHINRLTRWSGYYRWVSANYRLHGVLLTLLQGVALHNALCVRADIGATLGPARSWCWGSTTNLQPGGGDATLILHMGGKG